MAKVRARSGRGKRPESPDDEVRRLADEQRADREGRADQAARRERLRRGDRGDVDNVVSIARGGRRLSGDELRQHVWWLSQREMSRIFGGTWSVDDAMGVAFSVRDPEELGLGSGRGSVRVVEVKRDGRAATVMVAVDPEPAHRSGERRAHELVAELRKWLAAADAFAHSADPAAGMVVTQYVHEVLGALRELRARELPSAFELPPSPRARLWRLARMMTKADGRVGTTDRELAFMSLFAGNWPESVDPREPIDPEEIVKLERIAVRKARQRERERETRKRRW
jgi:hypothetical protein